MGNGESTLQGAETKKSFLILTIEEAVAVRKDMDEIPRVAHGGVIIDLVTAALDKELDKVENPSVKGTLSFQFDVAFAPVLYRIIIDLSQHNVSPVMAANIKRRFIKIPSMSIVKIAESLNEFEPFTRMEVGMKVGGQKAKPQPRQLIITPSSFYIDKKVSFAKSPAVPLHTITEFLKSNVSEDTLHISYREVKGKEKLVNVVCESSKQRAELIELLEYLISAAKHRQSVSGFISVNDGVIFNKKQQATVPDAKDLFSIDKEAIRKFNEGAKDKIMNGFKLFDSEIAHLYALKYISSQLKNFQVGSIFIPLKLVLHLMAEDEYGLAYYELSKLNENVQNTPQLSFLLDILYDLRSECLLKWSWPNPSRDRISWACKRSLLDSFKARTLREGGGETEIENIELVLKHCDPRYRESSGVQYMLDVSVAPFLSKGKAKRLGDFEMQTSPKLLEILIADNQIISSLEKIQLELFSNVRVLNLSHNKISRINLDVFTDEFPMLDTLYLDHCGAQNTAGIIRAPALTKVSMAYNQFQTLHGLLKPFSRIGEKMVSFNLVGNPVTNKIYASEDHHTISIEYLFVILNELPNISYLDGVLVSDIDKIERSEYYYSEAVSRAFMNSMTKDHDVANRLLEQLINPLMVHEEGRNSVLRLSGTRILCSIIDSLSSSFNYSLLRSVLNSFLTLLILNDSADQRQVDKVALILSDFQQMGGLKNMITITENIARGSYTMDDEKRTTILFQCLDLFAKLTARKTRRYPQFMDFSKLYLDVVHGMEGDERLGAELKSLSVDSNSWRRIDCVDVEMTRILEELISDGTIPMIARSVILEVAGMLGVSESVKEMGDDRAKDFCRNLKVVIPEAQYEIDLIRVSITLLVSFIVPRTVMMKNSPSIVSKLLELRNSMGVVDNELFLESLKAIFVTFRDDETIFVYLMYLILHIFHQIGQCKSLNEVTFFESVLDKLNFEHIAEIESDIADGKNLSPSTEKDYLSADFASESPSEHSFNVFQVMKDVLVTSSGTPKLTEQEAKALQIREEQNDTFIAQMSFLILNALFTLQPESVSTIHGAELEPPAITRIASMLNARDINLRGLAERVIVKLCERDPNIIAGLTANNLSLMNCVYIVNAADYPSLPSIEMPFVMSSKSVAQLSPAADILSKLIVGALGSVADNVGSNYAQLKEALKTLLVMSSKGQSGTVAVQAIKLLSKYLEIDHGWIGKEQSKANTTSVSEELKEQLVKQIREFIGGSFTVQLAKSVKSSFTSALALVQSTSGEIVLIAMKFFVSFMSNLRELQVLYRERIGVSAKAEEAKVKSTHQIRGLGIHGMRGRRHPKSLAALKDKRHASSRPGASTSIEMISPSQSFFAFLDAVGERLKNMQLVGTMLNMCENLFVELKPISGITLTKHEELLRMRSKKKFGFVSPSLKKEIATSIAVVFEMIDLMFPSIFKYDFSMNQSHFSTILSLSRLDASKQAGLTSRYTGIFKSVLSSSPSFSPSLDMITLILKFLQDPQTSLEMTGPILVQVLKSIPFVLLTSKKTSSEFFKIFKESGGLDTCLRYILSPKAEIDPDIFHEIFKEVFANDHANLEWLVEKTEPSNWFTFFEIGSPKGTDVSRGALRVYRVFFHIISSKLLGSKKTGDILTVVDENQKEVETEETEEKPLDVGELRNLFKSSYELIQLINILSLPLNEIYDYSRNEALSALLTLLERLSIEERQSIFAPSDDIIGIWETSLHGMLSSGNDSLRKTILKLLCLLSGEEKTIKMILTPIEMKLGSVGLNEFVYDEKFFGEDTTDSDLLELTGSISEKRDEEGEQVILEKHVAELITELESLEVMPEDYSKHISLAQSIFKVFKGSPQLCNIFVGENFDENQPCAMFQAFLKHFKGPTVFTILRKGSSLQGISSTGSPGASKFYSAIIYIICLIVREKKEFVKYLLQNVEFISDILFYTSEVPPATSSGMKFEECISVKGKPPSLKHLEHAFDLQYHATIFMLQIVKSGPDDAEDTLGSLGLFYLATALFNSYSELFIQARDDISNWVNGNPYAFKLFLATLQMLQISLERGYDLPYVFKKTVLLYFEVLRKLSIDLSKSDGRIVIVSNYKYTIDECYYLMYVLLETILLSLKLDDALEACRLIVSRGAYFILQSVSRSKKDESRQFRIIQKSIFDTIIKIHSMLSDSGEVDLSWQNLMKEDLLGIIFSLLSMYDPTTTFGRNSDIGKKIECSENILMNCHLLHSNKEEFFSKRGEDNHALKFISSLPSVDLKYFLFSVFRFSRSRTSNQVSSGEMMKEAQKSISFVGSSAMSKLYAISLLFSKVSESDETEEVQAASAVGLAMGLLTVFYTSNSSLMDEKESRMIEINKLQIASILLSDLIANRSLASVVCKDEEVFAAFYQVLTVLKDSSSKREGGESSSKENEKEKGIDPIEQMLLRVLEILSGIMKYKGVVQFSISSRLADLLFGDIADLVTSSRAISLLVVVIEGFLGICNESEHSDTDTRALQKYVRDEGRLCDFLISILPKKEGGRDISWEFEKKDEFSTMPIRSLDDLVFLVLRSLNLITRLGGVKVSLQIYKDLLQFLSNALSGAEVAEILIHMMHQSAKASSESDKGMPDPKQEKKKKLDVFPFGEEYFPLLDSLIANISIYLNIIVSSKKEGESFHKGISMTASSCTKNSMSILRLIRTMMSTALQSEEVLSKLRNSFAREGVLEVLIGASNCIDGLRVTSAQILYMLIEGIEEAMALFCDIGGLPLMLKLLEVDENSEPRKRKRKRNKDTETGTEVDLKTMDLDLDSDSYETLSESSSFTSSDTSSSIVEEFDNVDEHKEDKSERKRSTEGTYDEVPALSPRTLSRASNSKDGNGDNGEDEVFSLQLDKVPLDNLRIFFSLSSCLTESDTCAVKCVGEGIIGIVSLVSLEILDDELSIAKQGEEIEALLPLNVVAPCFRAYLNSVVKLKDSIKEIALDNGLINLSLELLRWCDSINHDKRIVATICIHVIKILLKLCNIQSAKTEMVASVAKVNPFLNMYREPDEYGLEKENRQLILGLVHSFGLLDEAEQIDGFDESVLSSLEISIFKSATEDVFRIKNDS